MSQDTMNKKRLEELILYIARAMERDQHNGRGRMKLAKFLFFIDFEAFARWGRTVTGTRYHAENHGPAPTGELLATRDLQSHGRFEWRREWDRQELPVALDDPDESVFEARERELIDEYLTRYRTVSAKRMIDAAHDFPGWIHAWNDGQGKGQPVYPEAIFWDAERVDHADDWENEVARELAQRFAHRLQR